MRTPIIIPLLFVFSFALLAQEPFDPSSNQLRQMRTEFNTPNENRTASGAPGHAYWQQEANYRMNIVLDDEHQRISGESEISYVNHSPDPLTYLWVQLDQNVRAPGSMAAKASPSKMYLLLSSSMKTRFFNDFEGGFHIEYVRDELDHDIPVFVNETMMRVDLTEVLEPGDSVKLRMKWWYNINDRMKDGGGRSGMEYFPGEDNYIYTIAQFFPRMAVYNNVEGWQNMQFLGRNEFALPFGDYEVAITVPSDHVVGATGRLINPEEVLSPERLERLQKAGSSTGEVVFIVTEEEAREAEKNRAVDTRTWKYRAENVRDFAFASSRKFIWDAMAVPFGERMVLAASLYPKEGNPLWEKYSTRVVAHTLDVYSRHTFDYPYPVAYSVHTIHQGMEYPMMAFNGGRPNDDGTYSERTKWSMIGVIIHEVGHNYFPMIVNSDERQWTWMDEGLNSFLQGVAEREWDHNHPWPKGRPESIVHYMKGDPTGISPVMVNGGLAMQFNNNAYKKPATALNILRETVMGRELFDFAFREYARRWMFKHPTPEDFFRTMEDASAVDLDWYWRGWFYTTDHVDIALDTVFGSFSNGKAIEPMEMQWEDELSNPESIAVQRNRASIRSMVERYPGLRDMYDEKDSSRGQRERTAREGATKGRKKIAESEAYYYQLDFSNRGGLVMPLVIQFNFDNGESTLERIPVEIWRRNNLECSKVFRFSQKVSSVILDPNLETADCNTENNYWPPRSVTGHFENFRKKLP